MRRAFSQAGFFLLALTSAHSATRTFSYTGAEQTFTVPPGITSVTITAGGAQGGPSQSNSPAAAVARPPPPSP